MAYQTTFERYEMKYLLTAAQKQHLLAAMQQHMALDDYGRTTIRNIYFDTDSFRLIRRSLEKPAYKEKLRIRSYRQAGTDDPVFVELKKKYQSVVYKRRLSLPEGQVMDSFAHGAPLLSDGQTLLEIKTAGGIPLWLCHALTEHGIFQTSYSKYGTAYCRMMENETEGGLLYA